jgi:tetratricopeptide (TPR) repeat protein
LASKVGRAKAAIREGRFQEAAGSSKSLAEEADSMGMKYLSVECSTYLAEALMNTKDYSRARQELDRALSRAEKLRLRTLLARGQYLLATILRLTGNSAEASGHYREALRLLDEIRKEPGAGKVMERADLQPVYTESTRWAQAGKG